MTIKEQAGPAAVIIEAMISRRTRMKELADYRHLAMASQRTDALWLTEHTDLTLGEIAELAGVSRVTLDQWRRDAGML